MPSVLLQGVGGTPESIKEVLEEVDRDGDGRIDYDEFCTMMRGNEAPSRAMGMSRSGVRKGAV